jgi:protein MpaA
MKVVALLRNRTIPGVDLWLLPNLNPDGLAFGTRANAHGVDLNRNFPSMWKRFGEPGVEYSGMRPLSEPETRAARSLILRIRPRLTIWFHQPQSVVRAWGPSIPAARRYARLAGMPFRALAWPNGSAPNWHNHRFPHDPSFVVELPPGPLAPAPALRLARAVRSLASS